jgi:hypothetical protein
MIDYEKTLLMTPEPIWKAARRIPLDAVNRLFEQLGRIEASACMVNDHPYVGALCANHSFYYFMQGPEILKRLRALEALEHQELHRIFGMNHQHRKVAEVRPKIPQFRFPHMIYRSPYRHERAHFGTMVSQHNRPLASGPGWDYLLDPINIPLEISPDAQQMLARIDGRRDLPAVLGEHHGDVGTDEVALLIRLVLTGLVFL